LLLLFQVRILRTDNVAELSSEQLVDGINTLIKAVTLRQTEINRRLTQPALSNTAWCVDNCPVCMDGDRPPRVAYHCGHTVCTTCHSRLSACPICQGPADALLLYNVERREF
jgi:hypothetical protein